MATTRKTVATAKNLRGSMSPPEVILWQYLRGSPGGIKFRRQHPIGRYVIDFYCSTAKLAIEVDGIVHDMANQPERDIQRDSWLAEQRLQIVRVRAADLLASPQQIADSLLRLARSLR